MTVSVYVTHCFHRIFPECESTRQREEIGAVLSDRDDMLPDSEQVAVKSVRVRAATTKSVHEGRAGQEDKRNHRSICIRQYARIALAYCRAHRRKSMSTSGQFQRSDTGDG